MDLVPKWHFGLTGDSKPPVLILRQTLRLRLRMLNLYSLIRVTCKTEFEMGQTKDVVYLY